jgi:hypothetical protein
VAQTQTVEPSATDGIAIRRPGENGLGVAGGPHPSIDGSIQVTWVAQGDDLSVQEPLPLQGAATGAFEPLYITVDGKRAGRRVVEATYEHRLMGATGAVDSDADRHLFLYDERQDRWYLDVAQVLADAGMGADPADLHLFVVRLTMDDGTARTRRLMLRLQPQEQSLVSDAGSGPAV